MRPPHENIKIRVFRWEIQDGVKASEETFKDMTLGEKLRDYLVVLSHARPTIGTILVQLMTNTKVEVEFPSYGERLELLDPQDECTNIGAMDFFEIFVRDLEKKSDNMTQKFVIPQAMRRRRSL